MKTNLESVTAYIASFENETQAKLLQLQKLVSKTVKDCTESVSYGMPAYKYKGKPLFYFAGYAKHIGVYAVPNTHKHFEKELQQYKQGKGSVQFPLDEKLPIELIKAMILFRKESIDKT